ncbi:MAG: amidohydrolase family protein [Acidimicrobiales bacterium]
MADEPATPTPLDLAILGGTVVPCEGSEPHLADLAIRDGRVVDMMEPGQAVRADRTIDASGSAVLPGFVDSHTHIASNMLLRGLLEDTELFAWLDTMWRLKQNFDHEALYWASMCGLIEMAKSGITCFNEHFDAYAVTPEVRALEQVPLKATLGYGFADGGVYADVAEWSWAALADFDAASVGASGIDGDRVRLALSPHAPYSCSEAMWREVRALANDRGLPVHTHIAEGLRESEFMQKTYGKTTVQWLHDIGFLASDITAAHCSQLTASDIALFAEHDVKVAHCPICNAKLVSGTMDLRGLWAADVTVGLATDGPASHNTLDMFQEMKFAAIVHKQITGDPTFLTTREVLELATVGSAEAMHRPELGTISVGAPADLAIVDMGGAHVAPLYDIEAALVYGSRADDVTHTIVDGNVVVDNREVVGIDEEEVVARFSELALALRDRSV